MDLNRILREGFIAGCIGAAAVAVWFLVVDLINGQPLFTPAMLGIAVFGGETGSDCVVVEPGRIFGCTMIPVSAFVVVGCVAAALAAEVEYAPSTLFLVIVGFCFFEVGFYILVALLAKPLLGYLPWWYVAIGNGLAALGMGYFLWRGDPQTGERVGRRPPRVTGARGNTFSLTFV